MDKSELAYKIIQDKLKEGMIQGEMHLCLRDTGRLAGGYYTSGLLTYADLSNLESLAVSLAINKKEAGKKWAQAVEYGKKEPVTIEDSYDLYSHHENDKELDWDDEIGKVIDRNYLELKDDIPQPSKNWNGKNDLIKYLQTLFDSDDHVCYVTECWLNEEAGKYLPKRGCFDRTAGELIEQLNKTKDITDVIGDWNKEVGAWIRFNPLDGKNVYDANVTKFKYCLIESDRLTLKEQYAIIKELELPVKLMVHSGKKSIHAIIKVDADTIEEYKKRVDYLYKICKKNGFTIDSQNRNASRLSRLPGVIRDGKPQYIIEYDSGKPTFKDWQEWIEEINDDLPDFECLDQYKEPPKLADELIEGVLRVGHKMLLTGPSKAGKSFDLMELSVAIAEGSTWHGFQCKQGKVLYVNLELDSDSCIYRYHLIYNALKITSNNHNNIDVWNLRGKAKAMDQLAPKLIRRALKKQYIAIIIDPIYKVVTGDENSAEQMSKFCNQFDKICTELKAATIYCHHHSKGSQGQKKSMDRGSGSGVFGRDPDAVLDMIELEIDNDRRKQIQNLRECKAIKDFLDKNIYHYREISLDDQLVSKKFYEEAIKIIPYEKKYEFSIHLKKAREAADYMTGWRIECRLREFRDFKPRHCFFDFPIHISDEGLLEDAKADGEEPPWMKNKKDKKKAAQDRKNERLNALAIAYENHGNDGEATLADISEELGLSEKQTRTRIKEHPDFYINKGLVSKQSKREGNN